MAECKAVIRTGYHLLNKEEVVGMDILNLINKREYSVPGSEFIFEIGQELTYGLAEELTIDTSDCGEKTYKVCRCGEDTEIKLKIDKKISCAKKFNKCVSDLNGNDAQTQLAKRLNETQRQVNADMINTVMTEMKSAGESVTADLSTTEGVIKYLEDINASFDEAGYLQSWNPTNALGEVVGSVGARYVFLDSVVFDKLRKAQSEKCCVDLVVFSDVAERMQFMGMTIVRVVRMVAIFGLSAMAFYAPHVLMVAKCEEQADVRFDVIQSNSATEMAKYDAILASTLFGFELVSRVAVQYVEASVVTL